MDKLSYKELLSDEMIKSSKLNDKINEIKTLVENHSNDMELGGKIRALFFYNEKNKHQINLFKDN